MSAADTLRIGDATYDAPFNDNHGRPMVAVWYDDGDRFVTYAVPTAVLEHFAR